MKINAITNTNFKGLFTDRTKENNGNWRMEYRPYSWETPKANKVQIDIFSPTLPDNEEIYINEPNLKISKDIFGTKSYIKDTTYGLDILRIDITDMPSMDLEESLKVKDKKLTMFLKMKQDEMKKLKSALDDRMPNIEQVSKAHYTYANDIDEPWGFHTFSVSDRAQGVRQNFRKMEQIAKENVQDFKKYIKLSESSDAVRKTKDEIFEELINIEEAKSKGLLIDISRRDIQACNEPLHKALQNIEKAKGKLVALSNGIITIDEIIKAVGKDFNIHKAIDFVEKLMQKKI